MYTVLRGFCGARNKEDLKENSRSVYKAHNRRVRKTVPKDQSLLYDLGSGWGWAPLCPFLGKPVPDVPFPKVNETEVVNDYLQVVLKMGLVSALERWASYTAPIAVVVVAALWWRGSD